MNLMIRGFDTSPQQTTTDDAADAVDAADNTDAADDSNDVDDHDDAADATDASNGADADNDPEIKKPSHPCSTFCCFLDSGTERKEAEAAASKESPII